MEIENLKLGMLVKLKPKVIPSWIPKNSTFEIIVIKYESGDVMVRYLIYNFWVSHFDVTPQKEKVRVALY
jgi:hypothetical protein